MSKLILILCSPKTGSSLVTQIFWRHGCWLSEKTTNHVNQFGYTSYESREVRREVKWQWKEYNASLEESNIKKVLGAPIVPTDSHLDWIHTAVDNNIPKDIDYWVFKTSAQSYPLFVQFDPLFVFVERDEDRAVQSLYDKSEIRNKDRSKDEIRKIHRRRMDTMRDVKEKHGGEWVNSDELMNGKFNSIQRAVEYCGLEYDPDLVDASLDPEKWHYKK